MLRTKLELASVALLVPALVMAFLIYWGPRQMEHHLDRAALAHGEISHYLEIALIESRQFRQLTEALVFERSLADEQLVRASEHLESLLDRLRQLTAAEVALVGTMEPAELDEFERLDRLEAIVRESIEILARFRADQHLERQSASLLGRLHTLDAELGDLVATVTRDEYDEIVAVDARSAELRHWLTITAATGALILLGTVIAIVWWFRRRLKGRIELLVDGTRRFAAGALDHRIATAGDDEIARLGTCLNWMAAELERQRQSTDRSQLDLARAIRERTAELERKNQTMRRLERLRRGMFADVSHELRTPLTVIRGEAEVALRAGDPSGLRPALERVAELADHVSKLVEDLVLMARSESAAAHLDVAEVDLGRLMADVCEDARAMTGSREIELVYLEPQAAVVVHGDSRRLRQLFLILVDNAVRYTQCGGRITMSLEADPNEATVTVADTGIGVAPDELSLVFDRAYRGSAATDVTPRGAGLGLHLAKSIIQAHRGDIRLASEPGAGTSVVVHLPRPSALEIDHEPPSG